MIRTKFALVLLVALAGVTSHAQAGGGTVMLGQSSFENRCDARGGDFSPDGHGYACEIGTLKISCLFEGANAACDWNGVQNQVEVVRVLGALQSESLVQPGGGLVKKGGGFQKPDFPIKWK